MLWGESLSRRERVARVSGPGEGYRKVFLNVFIFVPLTRRPSIDGAPSPVGRGCRKYLSLLPQLTSYMLLGQSKRRFYSEERDPVV